jgi:hypothetical protein
MSPVNWTRVALCVACTPRSESCLWYVVWYLGRDDWSLEMKRRTSWLCGLALVACTNQVAKPEASMTGTLLLAKGVTAPTGEVRLSIVWDAPAGDAALDSTCPRSNVITRLGETKLVDWTLAAGAHFPIAFSADLFDAPPQQVLRPMASDAGAKYARGLLVVYRDVNHDHQLTLGHVGTASVDEVLGSGEGRWPTLPLGDIDEIEYLTKAFEPQPLNLQLSPGYNLVVTKTDLHSQTASDSARPLEPSVDIQLTLSPNGYAQQAACATLCRMPDPALCPVDPKQLPALSSLGEPVDGFKARWSYVEKKPGGSVHYDALCVRDAIAPSGGSKRERYAVSIREFGACTTNFANCTYERGKLPTGVDIPCTQFDDATLP